MGLKCQGRLDGRPDEGFFRTASKSHTVGWELGNRRWYKSVSLRIHHIAMALIL